MIVYEDEELERAFLENELPVAAMLSARREADGALSVCVMRCAADCAEEYISRFARDPMSPQAIDFLTDRAAEFFEDHGCDFDPEEVDTLREFVPDEGARAPTLTDGATLSVCDASELSRYENLLDADLGEGICAAVTVGSQLVCAAGINDFSDSDECEIYVECAGDFRRRGYARCAVLALCERLMSHGDAVIYKTYSSNHASVALARSCGFAERAESLFLVGYSRSEFDEADE